ncbi:hypothetical protein [Dactylosporangium cerinum]
MHGDAELAGDVVEERRVAVVEAVLPTARSGREEAFDALLEPQRPTPDQRAGDPVPARTAPSARSIAT